MAGLERSWTKTLAFAVLLMGAGTAGFTQSAQTLPAEDTTTGSLTGKLTDLHSKPLEGVPVVVRNQATSAETRTITTKNGFTGSAGWSRASTQSPPRAYNWGVGNCKTLWSLPATRHGCRRRWSWRCLPRQVRFWRHFQAKNGPSWRRRLCL